MAAYGVVVHRGLRRHRCRLRWAWPGVDVVAGLAIDHQHDDRRGYENYTGLDAQRVLGQIGRLRRDEAGAARAVSTATRRPKSP